MSTDTTAILKRAGEIAKKRHPKGCGATILGNIVREAARELRGENDVRVRPACPVEPFRHAGHCNLALFVEPLRSEIVRQCTMATETDGRGWEPCVAKNHACHRCQHLAAIAMEARQRTDPEEGLDPKGDSAGPKDIAQGEPNA